MENYAKPMQSPDLGLPVQASQLKPGESPAQLESTSPSYSCLSLWLKGIHAATAAQKENTREQPACSMNDLKAVTSSPPGLAKESINVTAHAHMGALACTTKALKRTDASGRGGAANWAAKNPESPSVVASNTQSRSSQALNSTARNSESPSAVRVNRAPILQQASFRT